MAQFDVHRNVGRNREEIPYLLDVQADLLASLATRVVVPLARLSVLRGKPARYLNPVFTVEGKRAVMLTPEIAGIPLKALGPRVGTLAAHQDAIIRALDVIVTGV